MLYKVIRGLGYALTFEQIILQQPHIQIIIKAFNLSDFLKI